MSDGIVPQSRSQNRKELELMIQAANAVSYSLLYSLGRQYLDVSIEKGQHFQSIASVPEVDLEDFYFLRLEQVGSSSLENSLHQPFTALQTALASCHNPNGYTLVFIVSSDGKQNHIYLGIRSHNSDKFSPQSFAKNLGNFIQGNWKGTRLKPCYPDTDQEFKEQILDPLKNKLGFGAALTGIPSVKAIDKQAYPQSLDRLISGLRGSPFMYLVIAEPMARNEVDGIIYSLRDLIGQVHALGKISLNETFTESLSQALSTSEGLNWQKSQGTNESITTDNRWIKQGLTAVDVIAKTIGLTLFPPALFVSAFAELGEFIYMPKQQTSGTSTSESSGVNYSKSKTNTLSESNAISYGREYISAHAQAAEEILKRYVERFEQARASGCWSVGVYLLAGDPSLVQQGSRQLSGLLSGEKSFFEPIRIHDLKPVWLKNVRNSLQNLMQPNLALVVPKVSDTSNILHTPKPGTLLTHPLGTAFSTLTTPLNTEELALLVNFPQREVPGVKVMPTADFSANPPQGEERAIVLGKVLQGGEPTLLTYEIPLNALSKHGLISGVTGSGKSTTCLRLLTELSKQKIPFLIIEPAKEEYVEWAMQFNASLPPNDDKKITVYIPGTQTWRGHNLEQLTLNPLDFIWLNKNTEPQLLAHIDRLKSILNAVLPMQEVLPILLENALFEVYNKLGWLKDTLPEFLADRPTFSFLSSLIPQVVFEKGYSNQISSDLTAALQTRINSFLRGWKKKLFDESNPALTTPWKKIFDRPAVINLSQLGDDADKAFTMAVLLMFLYEYRQVQGQSRGALRHVTIIEEAHRILLKTNYSSSEYANPQAKTAEMFSNILSEIRAYGEGLLIVDQIPNRLVPDAIKNTNLKIVHRLVAADDREAMSAAMGLTPEQSAIINRLKPGQAIVYGDREDMATWIQVAVD